MATSGTYTFNLDLTDIIEEAYERCGLEMRTGYDLTTARRSMELLLQEWQNYQVNFWTIDLETLALTADIADYTLSYPILDVLDMVIRLTGSTTDIPMERISIQEYLDRTTKSQTGRPTHYAVLRGTNDSTMSLWVTPDAAYTLRYYTLRAQEDVGGTFTNNVDLPKRFLPAFVAGVAFKLAQKNPGKPVQSSDGSIRTEGGVDAQLRAELKAEYENLFKLARDEDRDRASLYAVPSVRRIT